MSYRRERGDGPSGPEGLSAQHTGCAGTKPAAKPYRREARGGGPSGPEGLSAQHTGCAGAKPAAKPYRRQTRGWRGEWYVYNHLLREFVREMHGGCPR